MKKRDVLRILDANFNRCREGLRVCEEFVRFLLNDETLTRRIKKARHSVSDCIETIGVPVIDIVSARNASEDVGREASALENKRRNALDLFLANAERAKESLRVLEEVSKFIHTSKATKFKKIRFEVYEIEKKALPKLEALRDHRSGDL